MEYRVTWSPEAVEDLESIAEYIERDSSFYAQAVVSKILEASRNIKDFPFIGRVVPEIGDENIRERLIIVIVLCTRYGNRESSSWLLFMASVCWKTLKNGLRDKDITHHTSGRIMRRH